MKKIYFLSAGLLLAALSHAQTAFWTEDFGTGCNRGQLATAYSGTNGAWTMTGTGSNGNVANTWYVSATSSNTGAGNCADNCIVNSVTNATLHVSNVSIVIPSFLTVNADTGASYFSGGFSSFGYTANTARRAESPLINCTGQSGILLTFLYLENGSGTSDDATLEYSADGGTTWTTLDPLAKTNTCTGSGQWTSFGIMLPGSADNNPNVKIGFNWVNNDDGAGSDPSFSVDDIALIPNALGVAAFNASQVSLSVIDRNVIAVNGAADWKLVSVTNLLGQPVNAEREGSGIRTNEHAEGVYVVTLDVNGVRVSKKVVLQ